MDNIHHSPYVNQAGYFVVADRVWQAQFALGEPMLAFPNPLLHLTSENLQEDSFHNCHWDEVSQMGL